MITACGTCVYYITLKVEVDSITSKYTSSTSSQAVNVQRSAQKLMESALREAKGVLRLEFVAYDQTVNAVGRYETNLKPPACLCKAASLQHDNATPHTDCLKRSTSPEI